LGKKAKSPRRLSWERKLSAVAPSLDRGAAGPDPDLLFRRACDTYNAGQYAAGVAQFRLALRMSPTSLRLKYELAKAIGNGGGRDEGEFREAVQLAREILEVEPGCGHAHLAAAIACHHLRLDDDTAAHLEAASGLIERSDPAFVALHYTRAKVRLGVGDYSAFPDFNRWQALLPGNHRRSSSRPSLIGAPWDGIESLDGRRMMLHTYHEAAGDTLQFIRFVPLLKARGADVAVTCHASLAPLLAEVDGIDRVFVDDSAADRHPEFRHDVIAGVIHLPGLLGATLETIPVTPYIRPPEEAMERWKTAIAGLPGLKIGIAYQGNWSNPHDLQRSFPLEMIRPLVEIPGTTFVCLQRGFGEEQLKGCGLPLKIPSGHAGEWSDTAGIIAGLDLVISPESAIAHLAGAMGVPVWIPLPFRACWRWLQEREDSPWYPTMRLFRQDRIGEWGPAFERMARALAEAVSKHDER
jgi:tetratricopeptide (TPR) repeat protein